MQLQEEISVPPFVPPPWALASVWALFLHVHPPQVSVASQVKGSESRAAWGTLTSSDWVGVWQTQLGCGWKWL